MIEKICEEIGITVEDLILNNLINENQRLTAIDYCELIKENQAVIELNRMLINEKHQLQDKINKAIEYIKENYLFNFKYDNEEIFEIIDDDKATRELLEILGDNNEIK